ncbi:xanthine dehydrogenase family protein molybdopterin-binding subunit [Massilia soli]|uniref:Xanthine dehydrogenase family protein molybdopterin-binding subunit n=1 Tax=Massilia soli TaxID=2792854 RepID=A0ABS7STA3_9BURK|nr:xanthine dehydrogenase family protein molybdopterin-binding subunit [Massilia soli]MBZ2209175.1 xanthine dehydrogenase family protein molybdopterin-binding subunit [Massilia soli]
MIGQPLPRLEDRRLVSGNGQYTDDINLDGQVYAAFLRSPHAHALLCSINVDAARAAPGVLAVLTGQDYLDAGFQGIHHVPNPADAIAHTQPAFTTSLTGAIFNQLHLPLPVDKVRHVGEPVAMVIAATALEARDACELIEVDFEGLGAVVDADAAMQEGAPELWEGAPHNICFQVQLGDRDAAQQQFAQAAHVVRREFRNSRIVNCQMEPRAAIGVYDAAAQSYTLISGSQGAHRQKLCLMGALRAPADKVRVVCPDVGGGFGPRSMVNVEQLAVVWGAKHVGRAVKWTGDRSEAFLSDYQGRDQITRAAIAFDKEGRILAVDNEWIGNVGAHTVSYVPMANGTRVMTTVYHVPVAAVHISGVMTNTVPTGPYRGAGRPEAHHMMERMLDVAAREMGIDRIEIRRRNLVSRAMLPYLSPMGLTYDSGDFSGNMERALVVADWAGFEERRAASRAAGKLRGIGMANYVEAPVGAPRERLEMSILAEGIVDIVSGTQTQGQGHATTFAQVVVAQLGVPLDSVRLRTGDTAFVSLGGGSHSDRTMRLGGTLLVKASAQIIADGMPAAASLLGVAQDALQYADGSYRDAQSGRSASLFDVAASAPLKAVVEIDARIPAHPTGCAVCELEIDPETGDVELTHYTSIDDVGQPINPLILEGQVHGGLAQGIGQAFSEGYHVDRDSGQVMSGSYMDYGVPRAGAVPPLSLEFTEDPTSGNPLRVKGGGESGITPATATIFNALADALRDISSDEIPMPATPAVIWSIIHNREGSTDGI